MAKNLNCIHFVGFSYGYVEIVDLATGEHSWQVDAMKGSGSRLIAQMPTLPEAVSELKKLLRVP